MAKYILSYTSASLSAYESEVMAGLYLESNDWSLVRKSVIDENVLQKGSLTGRKKRSGPNSPILKSSAELIY